MFTAGKNSADGNPGSGNDIITDFGEGDSIKISYHSDGFAKVRIEQVGADTVIHYSDDDTITLLGVSADSLVLGENVELKASSFLPPWVSPGEDDDTPGGGFTLEGGRGDDWLYGGTGKDTLDGGKGADTLMGGRGADRFVFDKKSETDHIRDFEDGEDLLVIKGGLTFSQLTIRQKGEDTVVDGPSDSFSIVLEGIEVSQLTESDFAFLG